MNKKDEHIKFCPHCGNKAPQEIQYTHKILEKSYTMDGELSDIDIPSEYNIAICKTCYGLLLYLQQGDYQSNRVLDYSYLLWPEFGIDKSAVPESIFKCYEEALLVKERSPNSFAVQIRRALEAICDDRGIERNNLVRRLEILSNQEEIPPIITSFADELRIIGNIGAHVGEKEVKPGFVRIIDDFFKVIIEYVYIAPKKLEDFRNILESFRQ